MVHLRFPEPSALAVLSLGVDSTIVTGTYLAGVAVLFNLRP